MLTEKDYCDYDTCVALREIGCRIETEWYIHQPSYERGSCYLCFGIPRETSVLDEYDYIPRLSLYETQKWLREVKKIDVGATWDNDEDSWFSYIKQMGFPDWSGTSVSHSCYSSYEEALSEGIKETIKILMDEGID